MNRGVVAGIVLLALTVPAWWIDARVLLACWLAAWWWCLGLVLGSGVNVWMHRLTGGAWGYPLRVVALPLARRLPWLLLGLVVIAATLKLLYPWAAQPQGEWREPLSRPAFTLMWLSGGFFVARLVVYALAWWWLARSIDDTLPKGRAAAALIVYALVTSLAAIDIVASLLPVWYSTAFGLVLLSTQAMSGAALGVWLSARVAPSHLVRRTAGAPPLGRDLGNLLLMWVMSWAYLAFMQFLVIWAENLPREIAWYVPRLHTGWRWGALALVFVQFALPFLALLFRAVKDQPARLAAVAAWLLAATAFDSAWLVLPSVDPHTLHGWWLLPLAFAGMGLLFFGGLPARVRDVSLPSPGALSDARA
jgi:hypothetical protein